jgi:hypothetical protein
MLLLQLGAFYVNVGQTRICRVHGLQLRRLLHNRQGCLLLRGRRLVVAAAPRPCRARCTSPEKELDGGIRALLPWLGGEQRLQLVHVLQATEASLTEP